jgi:hypothetical protein
LRQRRRRRQVCFSRRPLLLLLQLVLFLLLRYWRGDEGFFSSILVLVFVPPWRRNCGGIAVRFVAASSIRPLLRPAVPGSSISQRIAAATASAIDSHNNNRRHLVLEGLELDSGGYMQGG